MNTEIEQLKRENARLKELQAEGIAIATEFKNNTGMVWGERIEAYIAECNGTHFNPKEYNYERMPGEQ